MTLNIQQPTDISISLKKFIIENFLYGKDTGFKDDTSFLENGIIDSMGFLELIDYLESTYPIQIKDDELIPENMDSIANLTSFIIRKFEENTDSQISPPA